MSYNLVIYVTGILHCRQYARNFEKAVHPVCRQARLHGRTDPVPSLCLVAKYLVVPCFSLSLLWLSLGPEPCTGEAAARVPPVQLRAAAFGLFRGGTV